MKLSNDSVQEACRPLILDDATLQQVMSMLNKKIVTGLNHKTRDESSVKCYVTYVQDLPTGQESGKFFALDLGGTNFRVLLITLKDKECDLKSRIYSIPEDTMKSNDEKLFGQIAYCLSEFAKEHGLSDDNLPLGFTFSFPLKQVGLTKGILMRWTKGFSCSGVIGEDVVSKLKVAIQKRGDVDIRIFAILNDTTGTLMSCAWKNPNCRIGVILGTGSNACYVEKIENIPDFDGDKSKPFVIINTEWGAFGDSGELDFIRTSFDKDVDSRSLHPNIQLFEKMISGMYLGELVRVILVQLANSGVLFKGQLSETLKTQDAFLTKYISKIDSEEKGTYTSCRKVLENKLGLTSVSDDDCINVRYICECVSRRAAHLASAGIATLLNKMGTPSVTVGVDGSLYRFHPHFHRLLCEKIKQLINPNITDFQLMLSEDGSGRGAALVAAAASAK